LPIFLSNDKAPYSTQAHISVHSDLDSIQLRAHTHTTKDTRLTPRMSSVSLTGARKVCILCNVAIGADADYLHRQRCGHHQCLWCTHLMANSGKTFCTQCPPPQRQDASATKSGAFGSSLVIGDAEQIERVGAELLREREARLRVPSSFAD
jgi:hypothetical protein